MLICGVNTATHNQTETAQPRGLIVTRSLTRSDTEAASLQRRGEQYEILYRNCSKTKNTESQSETARALPMGEGV